MRPPVQVLRKSSRVYIQTSFPLTISDTRCVDEMELWTPTRRNQSSTADKHALQAFTRRPVMYTDHNTC